MRCGLLDAPIVDGAGQAGCEQAPEVLRAAGLPAQLAALGHEVVDFGRIDRLPADPARHPNPAVRRLGDVAGWVAGVANAVYAASADCVPIVLGGDHSVSAGTINAMARRAAEAERPFFVLWLDAHPDIHTLETTESGNLHGVPVAYALGDPSFVGYFPELAVPVEPANVCMMGLRSVDPAEDEALCRLNATLYDMRVLDEQGIARPLECFLDRVASAGGMLHVSFDADVLDPDIAPGVGTPVPGGLTLREAHLIMEILHDSGLVTSLDLVELNPSLDERGRTARLLVDLTASLMGRRVLGQRRRRTAA